MHVAHQHEWEQQEEASASLTGDDPFWADLAAVCGDDPACAAGRLTARADWRSLAQRALASPDRGRRERAIAGLAELAKAGETGKAGALELLGEAAASEGDLLLRLEEARALARGGDRRGFEIAVELLGDGIPAVLRDDAHQFLVEKGGRDFGFDPFAPEGANREAIARWQEWARAR